MDIIYFTTAAEFREWLDANHAGAAELWIGFYRKDAALSGITYPEAVDEALCYGWIDGIRKRVDDSRYTNRFTPRRKGSNWSEVNIRRVGELEAAGRMHPAGLAAFHRRDGASAQSYSYEARERGLDDAAEAQLRADEAAWAFWESQPPSYRKAAAWWVMSAKREETRRKRLLTLIADSAAGLRIKELRR